MRIARSRVLGLAAVFVFGGSSSLPFVAADPPAASPTSPVTGGVARSVAPEPADRHAETITLTVVCETPDGKPIAGAEVTCFEIDTWTALSRVKATHKTDAAGTCRFEGVTVPLPDVSRVLRGHARIFCNVAAKAIGRASVVRTLNVGGFPVLQHINGSTGWMKLVMEPAQTLQGRITNSKGAPIEGALVEQQAVAGPPLDGFCSARTDKNGECKITDLKEWVRPKDAGEIHVTSRRGNQVMGQQVLDHFFIRVWHPEYGEKRAEGAAHSRRVKCANARGRKRHRSRYRRDDKCTSAGRPCSCRSPAERAAGDFQATYSSNWAITDRDGNYRFGLRAENDYLIFSNFKGFIQNKKSPRISAHACERHRNN